MIAHRAFREVQLVGGHVGLLTGGMSSRENVIGQLFMTQLDLGAMAHVSYRLTRTWILQILNEHVKSRLQAITTKLPNSSIASCSRKV